MLITYTDMVSSCLNVGNSVVVPFRHTILGLQIMLPISFWTHYYLIFIIISLFTVLQVAGVLKSAHKAWIVPSKMHASAKYKSARLRLRGGKEY